MEDKLMIVNKEDLLNLTQAGIIPNGTPSAQLAIFAKACQELGLSPFKKQIYLQQHWDKTNNRHNYTMITGIDGFRSIAERTGAFGGCMDAVYNDTMTAYQCVSENIKQPVSASVTVIKIIKGVKIEISATALWSEYYPGKNKGFMWDKMPFNQLAKCAEAKALRKSFPESFSGIYSDDEMLQAEAIPEVTDQLSFEEIEKQNSLISELDIILDEFVDTKELLSKAQSLAKDFISKGLNETLVKNKINEKSNILYKTKGCNDEC